MRSPLQIGTFVALLFGAISASSQSLVWNVNYNGTGASWDESRLLYVDAAGNSYVGSYAYTLTGGEDMAIVKYDNTGTQLWVATYDATLTGNIDWVNSLAVDASGNVYVTGYTTDFSGSGVVIKFNSSGVYQWIYHMTYGSTVTDEGASIVTDGVYVYATAKAKSLPWFFWFDIMTVKLSCSTGAVQAGWPVTYSGTPGYDDVPTSLALDGSGNVFVAGYTMTDVFTKDYLTIGYTSAGAVIAGWPQTYNGTGNGDDMAVQVLTSGTRVVVTGASTGAGTSYDILTLMYNGNGTTVAGWPQRYNGTGNNWDGVGNTNNYSSYVPMAIDASGNVYVCGWIWQNGTSYDIITIGYDPSGSVIAGWPQIYNGSSNGWDIGRGIALDASANVYITGYTNGGANQDYVTIKYNSSGAVQTGWPVTYDRGGGTDEAMAIKVVGACVWVTGNSTNGSTDMTTIAYCDPVILPVELLSFQAVYEPEQKDVLLTWQTASETNNSYFTIEKSIDAVEWAEVEKIKAAGTAKSKVSYRARDNEPSDGVSYYRLRQTDQNGKHSFSELEEVDTGLDPGAAAFPNPCSGAFNLVLDAKKIRAGESYELVVYDMFGKSILRRSVLQNSEMENVQTIRVPVILEAAAKGLYHYTLVSATRILAEGQVAVQ